MEANSLEIPKKKFAVEEFFKNRHFHSLYCQQYYRRNRPNEWACNLDNGHKREYYILMRPLRCNYVAK
jgi:hypothetical protein